MNDEPKRALLRPDAPQVGPVSVEDIRAALAYLEPDDPALQAMIDGTAPFDLVLLEQVVENTVPFWRVVLKDRRLGLWAALVHFFETVEREGEREDEKEGREKKLAMLGGLMLRTLEAEWARLHPAEGRRDLNLLGRDAQLLTLFSALLDRLAMVDTTRRPRLREPLLNEIEREVKGLSHGSDDPLAYYVKYLASVLRARVDCPGNNASEREAFVGRLIRAIEERLPGPRDLGLSIAGNFLDKLVTLELATSKIFLDVCFGPLMECVLRAVAASEGKLALSPLPRILHRLFRIVSCYDASRELGGQRLTPAVREDTVDSLSSIVPLERSLIDKCVGELMKLTNPWDVREFSLLLAHFVSPPIHGGLLGFFRSLSPWRRMYQQTSSMSSKACELFTGSGTPPAPSFPFSSNAISSTPSHLVPIPFAASVTTYPSSSSLTPPLPTPVQVRAVPKEDHMPHTSSSVVLMHHDERGGQSQVVVVKYGQGTSLEESDLMRFVAAKTSITVPKVFAVDEEPGGRRTITYVYMSFLIGTRLDYLFHTLPACHRTSLRDDLVHALDQLLRLRPTPGFVGGFSNTFHEAVSTSVALDISSNTPPRPLNALALSRWMSSLTFLDDDDSQSRSDSDDHSDDSETAGHAALSFLSTSPLTPLCFMHGDYAGRNILVDPVTGRLTAVIDWERAGWWPLGTEELIVEAANQGRDEEGLTSLGQFLSSCLLFIREK